MLRQDSYQREVNSLQGISKQYTMRTSLLRLKKDNLDVLGSVLCVLGYLLGVKHPDILVARTWNGVIQFRIFLRCGLKH